MGFEGTETELVVLDTEGTGDGAKAMFKELVLNHGIAVVIGPLTQEEAYPAVAEAQAAGVPLVSLSQAPDQTDAGNWIFQTALTPEHQVRTAQADDGSAIAASLRRYGARHSLRTGCQRHLR